MSSTLCLLILSRSNSSCRAIDAGGLRDVFWVDPVVWGGVQMVGSWGSVEWSNVSSGASLPISALLSPGCPSPIRKRNCLNSGCPEMGFSPLFKDRWI